MILLEVVAFQGDARVETARRDPDTGPWKATKRWFSEARKSHQIALILKELLVKDYNSLRCRKKTNNIKYSILCTSKISRDKMTHYGSLVFDITYRLTIGYPFLVDSFPHIHDEG